jgi:hypothetical protein
MDLIRDIKLRCGYKAEALDLSDESIAFLLQMGWVKKFMGRYIFTRRGVDEFKAYIQERLKEDKI